MNREIKFEYGFESVNGIVKKVYHLHEIPNIKEKCDVWNVLPIKYVREFTGLKDRNGNDIYEGDLLRIPDYSNGAYFGIKQPTKVVDVSLDKIFNGYGYYGLHHKTEEIEVIGNIFKNPEILSND